MCACVYASFCQLGTASCTSIEISTSLVSPETKLARKRRGRELISENLESCAEDAELTIVHRYLQRRGLAICLCCNACCKVDVLKFRDLNSSARVILTRASAQPATDFSVAEGRSGVQCNRLRPEQADEDRYRKQC